MQQICNYSMMTLSPHWVSTSLDYSQEARLKISHKYLGPYVKQYSVRIGAQGHDEAWEDLAQAQKLVFPSQPGHTHLPATVNFTIIPPMQLRTPFQSCTLSPSPLHVQRGSSSPPSWLYIVYCVASKLQGTSTLPPFLYMHASIITQGCTELLDTVTHLDFQ